MRRRDGSGQRERVLEPRERSSSPSGPCMRGKMDIEHWEKTGEMKMIEPFEEYTPPLVDPLEADTFIINAETAPPNRKRVKRLIINPKKPSKDVLEGLLRQGLSAAEIGAKFNAGRATIYNWIKGYKLQGIKGEAKTRTDVADTAEMVQESPTLEDLEQFHTDGEIQELPKVEADQSLNIPMETEEEAIEKAWSDAEAEHYQEPEEVPVEIAKCEDDTQDAQVPEPFAEVWQDVAEDLKALRRSYRSMADKTFSDKLQEVIRSVTLS